MGVAAAAQAGRGRSAPHPHPRPSMEAPGGSALPAARSSTIEGASASCSGCCRSASLLVVNAACSGFCAHRPTVPPTPARPRRGLGFPRTTSLEAAPRLGSSRPREAGAEVLGQKARPSCPARVHRERASCLLPHAPPPRNLLQPPPPRCPGESLVEARWRRLWDGKGSANRSQRVVCLRRRTAAEAGEYGAGPASGETEPAEESLPLDSEQSRFSCFQFRETTSE